ncbi:MAG: hypothetical protein ABII27_01620 [bacterium]
MASPLTALISVIIVASLVVVAGSTGLIDFSKIFTPAEVGGGFTPIFCAEYEFKCCSIHGQPTGGGVTNEFFFRCPTNADRCAVSSFYTQGAYGMVNAFDIGVARQSTNCEVKTDIFGRPYASCVNPQTLPYAGIEVVGGMFINSDALSGQANYAYSKNNIAILGYYWKLFDCGLSACAKETSGQPLSPTCNWVGDYLEVYDENNRLIDPGYEGLPTVPNGECWKTTGYSNRRICGYLEEKCDSNSECASKYPYKWTESGQEYGATCSSNMLTLYGCVKQPGDGECIFIGDVNKNGKLDDGETCFEYAPTSWCGAIAGKTIPVGCCPDQTNACSSNAVCNPQTFKCEETRECTADWQCESAGTNCDYTTKKLKDWGCLATGKCGVKKETAVECCSSVNCADGFHCNNLGVTADYKCYETPTPKPICPFQCCDTTTNPNDAQYIQKPCSPDKPYCCPSNLCAEDLESCSPTNGKSTCVTQSMANGMPEFLAGSYCWLLAFIPIFIVSFIFIIIGAVILFAVPKTRPLGGLLFSFPGFVIMIIGAFAIGLLFTPFVTQLAVVAGLI